MPEFEYRAKDEHGTTRTGRVAAATRQAASRQLREHGWVVLSVVGEEKKSTRSPGNWLRSIWPIRPIDIETGLQQMSVMLRSGVTIVAASTVLAGQRNNMPIARLWNDLADHVRRGRSLSTALESSPHFPAYVRRLVQIGEQTGTLPIVLDRGARMMNERRTARESMVLATIYPALLLVLCCLITVYMLIYLMPRLDSYLNSLGKQLPPMTRLLVDLSDLLRNNASLLLTLITFLLLGGIALLRLEPTRAWIDQMLFRVPVAGRLVQLNETRVFCRSLSVMLSSGITLTDSLATAEQMTDNRYLKRTIANTRQAVINGSSLVDALDGQSALSPLMVRMVAAAEQSGQLGQVLQDTAELHESQFRFLVKRITALVTPLATLLIGGVVGYIYIAFFSALVAAGT
jgi:type IV pilus assembly protein PilC